MLGVGPIAPEPERSLETPQIEAFRKILVVARPHRRDGDRAGRRPAWAVRIRGGRFDLIDELKPEVCREVERARRESHTLRRVVERGDGGALSEPERGDTHLDDAQ